MPSELTFYGGGWNVKNAYSTKFFPPIWLKHRKTSELLTLCFHGNRSEITGTHLCILFTTNYCIHASRMLLLGYFILSRNFVARGFSHWHDIRICACLLGRFFAKFDIAIGGFSSETKEPKLHKLGVFLEYCKKHPIWSKLGAFLSQMVNWWVGN